MLRKNNFLFGITVGLIAPGLVALISNLNYYSALRPTTQLAFWFIAVLINLLLVRFFHKEAADKTVLGIMLTTFILVIYLFLIRFHS